MTKGTPITQEYVEQKLDGIAHLVLIIGAVALLLTFPWFFASIAALIALWYALKLVYNQVLVPVLGTIAILCDKIQPYLPTWEVRTGWRRGLQVFGISIAASAGVLAVCTILVLFF